MSATLAVRRIRRTGEGDDERKLGRTRPVLPPATDVPILYREVATAFAAIHRGTAGMRISEPTDPEEVEADRAADRIMRSAWETTGTESRELPPVRRPGGASSGGEALRPQDRVLFERHFGVELSGVRIHDDAMSARGARALAAHAFTAGSDISFGVGRYAPETSAGRRLLAHELAHVVHHPSRGMGAVHRFAPGTPLGVVVAALKVAVMAAPAYNALKGDDRARADRIMGVIDKRPIAEQVYLYIKLKQLFDTPVKSQAAITTETHASTVSAAKTEATRVSKPAAKAATDTEEKASADKARTWTAIKGKFGGGTYYVDRTDPKNIVVRADIMLTPSGTGSKADVDAIKSMEDGIEKAASTKGYLVDIRFVDVARADTFRVEVNPAKWEVATNWSGGDPIGFAHELHHMFAFELDRYNYIETQSTNESMEVGQRLVWFEKELGKPANYNDPTSIMDSAQHPSDSDVCAVAGLDEKTCIAARVGKGP
jgi:hypothetical protein